MLYTHRLQKDKIVEIEPHWMFSSFEICNWSVIVFYFGQARNFIELWLDYIQRYSSCALTTAGGRLGRTNTLLFSCFRNQLEFVMKIFEIGLYPHFFYPHGVSNLDGKIGLCFLHLFFIPSKSRDLQVTMSVTGYVTVYSTTFIMRII